jgi:hypothetical protein
MPAKTLRACTTGKRHKWEFAHNRITQSGGPTTIRISKRGVYCCACGETKLGEPGHA